MVHFRALPEKSTTFFSFCASEASGKVLFYAYLEFVYGFKA
ncbi:MAG: hypothetical protein U5L45_02200 [Saprospiraceae bacterium]|nr:hypothetical protein [Saprospiraceae bacterium]